MSGFLGAKSPLAEEPGRVGTTCSRMKRERVSSLSWRTSRSWRLLGRQSPPWLDPPVAVSRCALRRPAYV